MRSITAVRAFPGITRRLSKHRCLMPSKPSKHLTLAFLDPNLVEAAVDGVLPRGYGLSRFLDLPADWTDQWRVLGLTNQPNSKI